MIAYGIGVLLLMRELWVARPRVIQPWYADDAEAEGKFTKILEHLRGLPARGPSRGYYPDPTRIILVVALVNVARVEEFFRGLGIKVVMGHRYLGGYIRDKEAEGRWLAENITGWEDSVETLAGFS